MNQIKFRVNASQVKWVVALGVLSLAACSKSQPPSSTSVATNAAAATPPAATTAPTVKTPDIAKIQCKKGKETRVLEVTKKDSGYLLDYEKLGKMTTVSKSPVGLNQCMQEEKKIQSKLEHSGFNCT